MHVDFEVKLLFIIKSYAIYVIFVNFHDEFERFQAFRERQYDVGSFVVQISMHVEFKLDS